MGVLWNSSTEIRGAEGAPPRWLLQEDRPRNKSWDIREWKLGWKLALLKSGKQVLCRIHTAAGSIPGDIGKVPQGISR